MNAHVVLPGLPPTEDVRQAQGFRGIETEICDAYGAALVLVALVEDMTRTPSDPNVRIVLSDDEVTGLAYASYNVLRIARELHAKFYAAYEEPLS